MSLIKKNSSIPISLCIFLTGALLLQLITSCGKSSTSTTSLNVQYEILNLSPDLGKVDLYVHYQQINTVGNPFIFNVNHGYFYLPSVDTPFQIRSDSIASTTFITRDDVLQTGRDSLKYSLFITGEQKKGSLTSLFTVDTAAAPAIGRGKVRFVNVSPSNPTSGLDMYANGTKIFSKIIYQGIGAYTAMPVGNYIFTINPTSSTTVLLTLPTLTVQDGGLYTIYSYGYTTRTDTAAFAAGVITNK